MTVKQKTRGNQKTRASPVISLTSVMFWFVSILTLCIRTRAAIFFTLCIRLSRWLKQHLLHLGTTKKVHDKMSCINVTDEYKFYKIK